ncbi:MAG: hypothetical protein IT487_11230 [Chromatiaceae bacterium]|nr:hypothetical protein [Chromatiaceae bacterium]
MTPPRPPQVPFEPYHFCTYFDRNYLTRGLALYQSLREHCRRPFILWTLCFDDESHAILSRLGLEGMRLIHRADFEAGDAELTAARANRSAVEYFWTCTPSLPLYILRQDETIALITYLDADLFFYSDPQPIFDEFGAGSILIHGHRYAPEHAHFADTSGIYNVGLLSFRRDASGLECLHWWRDRCNEWCYARFEDGKYGDQKYLDDWPERFSGVVVLKHPGAGLAPWNLSGSRTTFRHGIGSVDDAPLIFYHFHSLLCVSPWLAFTNPPEYVITSSQLRGLHLPYLDALKRCAELADLPFVDRFSPPPEHTVRNILLQRYLLLAPRSLTLLLWTYGEAHRQAHMDLAIVDPMLLRDDRKAAFKHLGRIFAQHPPIVFQRRFIALTVKNFLGKARTERYRQWKRQSPAD